MTIGKQKLTETDVSKVATPPPPDQAPKPTLVSAPPTAEKARFRVRHLTLLLVFALWVIAPLTVAATYLYTVALDQYASHVGFSVRKEEGPSAAGLLGGLAEFSSVSNSSDTDILAKYIEGRQMLISISQILDLPEMYVRADDPVFSLKENATIEELEAFWQRVVKVYYDTRSELIEIRVLAFDPNDAQKLNQAIVDESTSVINRLNAVAIEDTIRYAKDELEKAVDRLKLARQNITVFRTRTKIVDPLADTQGQLGLINSLQSELTSALIELDLVSETANANDPRIAQGERRVRIIQSRIEEERNRLGSEENVDDTYSNLLGQYEELAVDLEFAEKNYLSALASYTAAQAEAQRKSRYLATYLPPTLAESAQYPQRELILGLLACALFLSWASGTLIYYSVRDRR